MATFPRTDAELMALAGSMLAGLAAHPSDFPSLDPAGVSAALAEFAAASERQTAMQAAHLLASQDRLHARVALSETLRNCIRAAQVDTATCPAKLAEIGWSKRATAQARTAPQAPTELRAVSESPGSVTLSWTKPPYDLRCPVSNYIIQRRELNGQIGNWQLVALSYQPEITLDEQPGGVRLEYRVIASNPAGNSLPGNVVAVML